MTILSFDNSTAMYKLADLHPRQDNLHASKEQFFCGLQNLSPLHKTAWRSAEKYPFFQTCFF
jgi:hypothetical protein